MNCKQRLRPDRVVWIFVTAAALFVTAAPAAGQERVGRLASAAPEAKLHVERAGDQLRVELEVPRLYSDRRPQLSVGAAARRHVVVEQPTGHERDGAIDRLIYDIPAERLVKSEADWPSLRIGYAVAWQDAQGRVVRRERYRHTDARAAFAPLSQSPRDWASFDLETYRQRQVELARQVRIEFTQPTDGKATVVIEDESGRRVRNLVSGQRFGPGEQTVVWDGLDEDGKLVEPGRYTWRGATHAGITPNYLMRIANGEDTTWRNWGPNHGIFQEVAANGRYVFLSAPITEGGYALVALKPDGTFVRGYEMVHGLGIGANRIAADEKYFYVAHDGRILYDGRKGERISIPITLMRYEIESARPVGYEGGPGRRRHREISRRMITRQQGRGPSIPTSLTDMVRIGEKLYIASRDEDAVFVVACETGDVVERLAVERPGRLAAAPDGTLLVESAGVLHELGAGGQLTERFSLSDLDVRGMAVDAQGYVYITDGRSHQVVVHDPHGKQVRRIGQRGGAYAGAYNVRRMVDPRGIGFGPAGKLWAAEDRPNPKRVLAWDVSADRDGGARVAVEKFGSPSYGSPGTGIDPQDHERVIAYQCLWKLDIDSKSYTPTHVLVEKDGHMGGSIRRGRFYRFHRENGRTYLIRPGKANVITELMPDGTLQDRAAIGTLSLFVYGCGWHPPQPLIDRIYATFDDMRKKAQDPQYQPKTGRGAPYHDRRRGAVLWADANGDGLPQGEEFHLTPEIRDISTGYWGNLWQGLTFSFEANIDGRTSRVDLPPAAVGEDGLLDYGKFQARIREHATPLEEPASPINAGGTTAVDSRGVMLFSGDPAMWAFDRSGQIRWRFPNRWQSVHGSHKAPLPEPGVMQGALYYLGMAPLDARGDVTMIGGNHGRFFVMTSDGLYLDEMFRDVRMRGPLDEHVVGGEPFGGFFERSEADGNYYLTATRQNLYRIEGLDTFDRMAGEIEVTPEQIEAARQRHVRRMVGTAGTPRLIAPRLAQPPTIDARASDWPTASRVGWDQAGQFPAHASLGYDSKNLYLMTQVGRDASPWVNGGKDWQLLFKTGDAVLLELALDADADAKRREPGPGDVRLLFAPMDGQPTAVLYRYVSDDTTRSATFSSPWRSVTVDDVRQLPEAQVRVRTRGGGYVLEARIPLESLDIDASELAGRATRGDFGVLYGDPEGQITRLRSYWANPAAGLVNDVPGETLVFPQRWGEIRFEGQ